MPNRQNISAAAIRAQVARAQAQVQAEYARGLVKAQAIQAEVASNLKSPPQGKGKMNVKVPKTEIKAKRVEIR